MDAAYAFDLKLVCGGYAYFSTDTLGSKPGPDGLEVRRPSEVSKERFGAALDELGFNYLWVDDERTFYDWTCVQGWALVASDFAREYMSHWLKKKECVISPYGSFTDLELASPSIRKRTFRGKFKKRILDRDNNQCILCAKKEQLTLQHVRPHSKGGETSFRNLVTLCAPCNQELGADMYRELYRLAGLQSGYEPSLLNSSDGSQRALLRAVQFSSNMMHTRCELY
ncbi:HNH endonuclease [Pseudomonas putida]|uniref:HNH endonuclease n=1 Tax=Pseudomonas putida TaxID=303 RepID=UPI0023637519|nr:HNH endonuclease [Pseudomonas putida]MDD2145238.1 HNH endonuclease [Pseudomonas putida]HDS1708395.1 HNH endonuclease [Pseudomonas putida]